MIINYEQIVNSNNQLCLKPFSEGRLYGSDKFHTIHNLDFTIIDKELF